MADIDKARPAFSKMKMSFYDFLQKYNAEVVKYTFNPNKVDTELVLLKEKAWQSIQDGSSTEAMYWYGYNQVTGHYGFDIHVQEGLELLKRAAELNDVSSKEALGDIYCGYIATNPSFYDPAKGIYYFEDANTGYSLYRLACCYYDGMGVQKDIPKAIEYAEKSATHFGCNHGKLFLGVLLYGGAVCAMDRERAYALFCEVMMDSNIFLNAEAHYWAGLCLYNGYGIGIDQKAGMELMRESAQRGEKLAIDWLWSINETLQADKNVRKPTIFRPDLVRKKPDGSVISAEPIKSKSDMDLVLKSFDDYIGFEDIKHQLRRLFYLYLANVKREEKGVPKLQHQSLHMVFKGEPGTGKTTVARMIGEILHRMGYLSNGHVVEVDRARLVGPWIGQTEEITVKVIESARGGVLFIDEAQALDAHNGDGPTDFGEIAISIVVKAMEDMRDDLVVIMAGYGERMGWLLKLNPGLASRIGMTLEFPSFTNTEMVQIFEKYCRDASFILSDLAQKKILVILQKMKPGKKDKFGNARGIRNLFEETLRRQAQRVIEGDIEDVEGLCLILPQDIPGDDKPSGGDGKITYLSRK